MKKFKNHKELAAFFKENPDPLGVQKSGGYKEYTMEEVAKHNAPPSIWSVYNGDIYDITMYVDVHPGGKKILEKVYGKDMTALFNKFHGYVNINAMIGPLKIGTLKKQQYSPNEQPKVENAIKEEDEDKSDN